MIADRSVLNIIKSFIMQPDSQIEVLKRAGHFVTVMYMCLSNYLIME